MYHDSDLSSPNQNQKKVEINFFHDFAICYFESFCFLFKEGMKQCSWAVQLQLGNSACYVSFLPHRGLGHHCWEWGVELQDYLILRTPESKDDKPVWAAFWLAILAASHGEEAPTLSVLDYVIFPGVQRVWKDSVPFVFCYSKPY